MLFYPHQEYGTRPMYRNVFWTSPYWSMPAGAGCQRTGKARNTTGLPQVQWCCPGYGTPYSNPYHYSTGLGGLGIHESDACPEGWTASWALQSNVDKGMYPQCHQTPNSRVYVNEKTGRKTPNVEICCSPEYREEQRKRREAITPEQRAETMRRIQAFQRIREAGPYYVMDAPADEGGAGGGFLGGLLRFGLIAGGIMGGGYLVYWLWKGREKEANLRYGY